MRQALLLGALLSLAACGGKDQARNDARPSSKEEPTVIARLDYFELSATNVARTRDFYTDAFGWNFTDFGPEYSATTTGDTDIGLRALGDDGQLAPLPVIRAQDLPAALESVEAAGGRITKPIFAFPGGRRFEAVDPSGNAFAVYVADETETGD